MLLFILVMCYAATFAAMLTAYYFLELRPMAKDRKKMKQNYPTIKRFEYDSP